MPESIRVPFAVDLPAGWRQIDPTLTGTGQTAFAAVRDSAPGAEFTPTITIDVDRAAQAPDFVLIADSAAGRLAAQVADLVVLDRTPITGDGPPGMTQVLKLRLRPREDHAGLELVQSQVHLAIPLGADDHLIVQLTCTSTPATTAVVAREFEQFVASFRLRPPEQEGRHDS